MRIRQVGWNKTMPVEVEIAKDLKRPALGLKLAIFSGRHQKPDA